MPVFKKQGPNDVMVFNVMDADRYICTMKMPVNLLFKPTLTEIFTYVLTKRPTLRYAKHLRLLLD